MSPTILNLIANVLLLSGYVVRDVLWLRIFCFTAGLFNAPFWLLQDSIEWEPVRMDGCLYEHTRLLGCSPDS